MEVTLAELDLELDPLEERRRRMEDEAVPSWPFESMTTGPEVVPLLTSVPRTFRLSSEAASVSLPTES